MKEIGLQDIVVAVVKKKEAKGQKSLEGSLKRNETDFGFPMCQYAERNKLDAIDFLQAIETFKANFTEEDIDSLFLKRLKLSRTQQSVGMIIAKKYSDMEMPTKLEQFLIEGLLKMELQPSDSYIFEVFIHVLEQMALIEDHFTQKRVSVYLCRYKNW